MHTFLSLSEDRKQDYPCGVYKVKQCTLLDEIQILWNIDPNFEGSYISDYKLLHNQLAEEKTSWTDKYTTALYSPSQVISSSRWELQPLPDYLRWLRTSELHFLPYEERAALGPGDWDEKPELFLPTRILDLCFSLTEDPPQNVMTLIALLAWITVSEAKAYYCKLRRRIEDLIKGDEERERWKNHSLYRTQTKNQLESLCKSLRIPVTAALNKHQLVNLVSQKKSENYPLLQQPLYCGKLSVVPNTAASLSKLTMAKLRAILTYHKCPNVGSKDQLVLRVLLLRQGHTAKMLLKEEQDLKALIKIVKELIFAQRNQNLSTHIYRRRTYNTTSTGSFLPVPVSVHFEADLTEIFAPLVGYVMLRQDERATKDERNTASLIRRALVPDEGESLQQQLMEVGAKVKIKWTSDEIGDSGWYIAYVQGYDSDADIITLQYQSEPDCTYTVELTPLITAGTIQLVQAVI